ncbi:UTP--glucose-1-phosphate uridylyltransferase GalU [Marinobacterium sediminicola]|uniref:UTP--glucose-1-phosphate uridylyltransferase n=1 Tax=Marinobacterium sediminicola TaxID=518898 RepID=A0ABY1S0N1_9GAMM|nr:UTP--glucose-1-phosphate uridylyltransferase GalU [Marinobacterium sediminicola]ULG68369.1 UTP--glucose-1-phosphate uridylyltransferase GalU [Marinobacterium sediminicola]SMR74752.1 UTP--glucose-1-phosphate uridylyltransferase [Marinobacterium sediminicola]
MLSKVVIPVAGLGTRVLPASKAIPKEMLPVVDKPVIQHVIEEAIAAGFTQIILVTRSGKSAIEDHFDHNAELEQILEAKGKDQLLASVRDVLPEGVQLVSVRQDKALGLGHAVHCAAGLIGEEDFAVMLPDMLIDSRTDCSDLQGMVSAYLESGTGQIMVEAVPEEHVERYGVVDCQGNAPAAGTSSPMYDVVEKPPREQAPSNLAIVGRYILPGRVMSLLATTLPGAGGEIQLTDAIKSYLEQGSLNAYTMTGDLYDCGNKSGLLQANIAFGLKHAETADDLKAFLAQL